MIDVYSISKMEDIQKNMKEIFLINKKTNELIAIMKEKAKYDKSDLEGVEARLKYTTYTKYNPIDMSKIIERYPIAVYPEMYKITLKAEASDIIMEDDLLQTDTIERCSIEID